MYTHTHSSHAVWCLGVVAMWLMRVLRESQVVSTCTSWEPLEIWCLIENGVKRDSLLCTVDELIFVGPFPTGAHTLVLPEDPCMVVKLLERETRGIRINIMPRLEITASQALAFSRRGYPKQWCDITNEGNKLIRVNVLTLFTFHTHLESHTSILNSENSKQAVNKHVKLPPAFIGSKSVLPYLFLWTNNQ